MSNILLKNEDLKTWMFICVLCCWWQMKQMGPILSGSISNFEIEFHLEMYSNRVCGIHHYVIIIHTRLLILTRYLSQLSTLTSKPPASLYKMIETKFFISSDHIVITSNMLFRTPRNSSDQDILQSRTIDILPSRITK